MTSRKQHNQDAGYIAERKNPNAFGKVVIYEAAPAGIDTGGTRYAVVCDAHATIVGCTSMPQARGAMKAPESFCDGCRAVTPQAQP